MMLIGISLLILFAIVFGKSGVAFVKGLLMLALGSVLLVASCAII
jgi:hypothetical protein